VSFDDEVDKDSAMDLIAAISLVTLFSIPSSLSSNPSIALANSYRKAQEPRGGEGRRPLRSQLLFHVMPQLFASIQFVVNEYNESI
jgi:hypothetical protein